MIKYIPFLKYKSNEIISLGVLDSDVKEQIIPFFDAPQIKKSQPEEDRRIFKKKTNDLSKSVKKHLGGYNEIYADNFDIDDIEIDGEHSYSYFLKSFTEHTVIPVVGIDRTPEYVDVVKALREGGTLESTVIALRFTPEDFLAYDVVFDEISDLLGGVIGVFTNVDLIFDCRVCTKSDSGDIGGNIVLFANAFRLNYSVRHIIVTGSSIPASIKDVLDTDSEASITRNEIAIYNRVAANMDRNIIFGDYATVSPLYSDVTLMPEMMQSVMTPKFIYSHGNEHFFIRGKSLKKHGYGQYFSLAKILCSREFFRGASYSFGDRYLDEKSNSIGSNGQPGAVIKPLVNAHISYMVKGGVI